MTKFRILAAALLSAAAFFNVSAQEIIEDDPSLSFGLTAEHYWGFDERTEQRSVFYADVIAPVNKAHTLRVVQPLVKEYEINVGEEEFYAADTFFYHYWTWSDNFLGPYWKWRLIYELPISPESRDNSVRSRFQGRLAIGHKFIDGKLDIAYRPFISYQVNSYKQSITSNPLPEWGIGNSFFIDYKATERLGATLILTVAQTYREKTVNQVSKPRGDGSYITEAFITYSLIRSALDGRIGYVKSDAQYSQGVREINVFDQQKSQFYIGLDYKF
jgi:hypothetical protein